MRPIIRLLAAAVAAAATIQSCSTLTGYPTDAEASYAKAIELTKKSVDTDKFKIYSLSIMEGETLSDNLFLVTVNLVVWSLPTCATYRARSKLPNTKRPSASTCRNSIPPGSPPRSPKPKRCFPKDTPTNR